MTPNQQRKRISWIHILVAGLAFTASCGVHAAKALLPNESEIGASARLPIDGLYMVSGINKRVRMEGGRAVVVDGWKHLFIWDVEPGMVVIRDIKHSGDGVFTGRDLPLQGDWRATFDKHKFSLAVVVNGSLGETKYTMTRVPDDTGSKPAPDIKPEEPVQVATVYARSIVGRCPAGQFHVPEKGINGCYACPAGTKRIHIAGIDSLQCRT